MGRGEEGRRGEKVSLGVLDVSEISQSGYSHKNRCLSTLCGDKLTNIGSLHTHNQFTRPNKVWETKYFTFCLVAVRKSTVDLT